MEAAVLYPQWPSSHGTVEDHRWIEHEMGEDLEVEESHRGWEAVPMVEDNRFYQAADQEGGQIARRLPCVDETVVGLMGGHRSENCHCQ